MDWKLEDRVMIAYGPDAGRVGTVTAVEMTGYDIHLDHPSGEPCEQKRFYPIHLVPPAPATCPRGHGLLENGDCPDCGFAT